MQIVVNAETDADGYLILKIPMNCVTPKLV